MSKKRDNPLKCNTEAEFIRCGAHLGLAVINGGKHRKLKHLPTGQVMPLPHVITRGSKHAICKWFISLGLAALAVALIVIGA